MVILVGRSVCAPSLLLPSNVGDSPSPNPPQCGEATKAELDTTLVAGGAWGMKRRSVSEGSFSPSEYALWMSAAAMVSATAIGRISSGSRPGCWPDNQPSTLLLVTGVQSLTEAPRAILGRQMLVVTGGDCPDADGSTSGCEEVPRAIDVDAPCRHEA